MRAIGFIGTGAMGLPIVKRLLGAGHALVCCDSTPSAMQGDVTWALSPRQVAESADIVFLCLPGEAAVRSVLAGEAGVLAGVRAGTTIVDMTTNPHTAAMAFGEMVGSCRGVYLDAPVLGGPCDAERGELAMIVSGPEAAHRKVAPLISTFTRRQTHVGKTGHASLFKVMQNTLGHVQLCAIAEVFLIVEKLGGDTRLFYQAVLGGGGMADSTLFEKVGKDFAKRDAHFGAKLWVGAKDADTGNALAKSVEVTSPMLQTARDHYQAALDMGLGDADLDTVAEAIRKAYGD